MEKQIRTTLYIDEQLYDRFRLACTKKIGDKQGKIKQGYVLAITNFCDDVLQDLEPPLETVDVSATKLNEIHQKSVGEIEESKAESLKQSNAGIDKQGTVTLSSEDVEAKAKKLAEERKKSQSDHKILQ